MLGKTIGVLIPSTEMLGNGKAVAQLTWLLLVTLHLNWKLVMNSNKLFFVLVFFLGISFSALLLSRDVFAVNLELLTPEEASQLHLTDTDMREELPFSAKTRSLSIGPKINFKTPSPRQDPDGIILVEIRGNSQLLIDFLKTQAEVDMSSLDVEAKKGLFSVSLTDRLKPYIHGNKLEANEIKIPPGQFTVIIRIADRVGTSTEKAYRFLVQ